MDVSLRITSGWRGVIIPQALSIALSIRELLRQGYLFGAHVLIRALVERAAILIYLDLFPEEIDRWNRGWHNGDAPGLAAMLDKINAKWFPNSDVSGRDLTAEMNSLLHAKPDSARWNTVPASKPGFEGYAVSKILNRPDLCDEACAGALGCLTLVQEMMVRYFPD
jgi:hypothetical protein